MEVAPTKALAYAAYLQHCAANSLPVFHHGECFSCHSSLYVTYPTGYSLSWMTGCPFCHRSFCD